MQRIHSSWICVPPTARRVVRLSCTWWLASRRQEHTVLVVVEGTDRRSRVTDDGLGVKQRRLRSNRQRWEGDDGGVGQR